jgi:hypothetical protein
MLGMLRDQAWSRPQDDRQGPSGFVNANLTTRDRRILTTPVILSEAKDPS